MLEQEAAISQPWPADLSRPKPVIRRPLNHSRKQTFALLLRPPESPPYQPFGSACPWYWSYAGGAECPEWHGNYLPVSLLAGGADPFSEAS
jgi:hypothetical protein